VLSKFDIIDRFDLIISNEDVKNSKPHPEMYWKAMSMMGCLPEETLIVEDSPYGLLAASRSKANVMRVGSPKEITYNNICKHLNKEKINMTPKWKDEKLNVLIPMAGAGSRFEQAGYTFPKPLIEVKNKPMIQVVIENLNLEANYIYVVQKLHREKYNLDTLLNLLTPGCKIVETDGLTEGAACTALLAKEYINNNNPLFFANSDQFVEWYSNEFMYKMNETDADGGIVTFTATHPKWSFAKVDEKGLDRLDRSVLTALIERFNGGPVGLSTLAIAVGEETETVEAVAEPFLVRNGFMARTPRGRIATELGWRHLGRTPPAGIATLFDTPAPNA
jgi:hypothetical protein